jgi:hypothetical protein
MFQDSGREVSNSEDRFIPIKTSLDLSLTQSAEKARNSCINGRGSICGKIIQVLRDGLVIESGYTNLLREPLTSSWLEPGTATASRAANLSEGNAREPLVSPWFI